MFSKSEVLASCLDFIHSEVAHCDLSGCCADIVFGFPECSKGAAVCMIRLGVCGLWVVDQEVGIRSVVPLGVYLFSELFGWQSCIGARTHSSMFTCPCRHVRHPRRVICIVKYSLNTYQVQGTGWITEEGRNLACKWLVSSGSLGSNGGRDIPVSDSSGWWSTASAMVCAWITPPPAVKQNLMWCD